MIERIVELHSKGKLSVFAEATDRGRFAEGEIRIELSGPVHDALRGTAVTGRSVGSYNRRLANGRLIDPIIQTGRRTA